MTQADSVHSTPPTNTSALPADKSRRGFLAQAAAVAAGGVTLGLALPLPGSAGAAERVPDLILDLIEAHRRAHLAHLESLELQSRLERKHRIGECGWVSEKPCHDENDAFEALVAAPAATVSGLIAWLDYLQELSSEFETEWMMCDRASAAVLVDSFVTSLQNIGVQAWPTLFSFPHRAGRPVLWTISKLRPA
jgi:hypothetical protein